MEEKLAKEKEVLDYLNISRTTLWRLKKEGLPIVKVGNSYRYEIEDVKEWIAKEENVTYQNQNKIISTEIQNDTENPILTHISGENETDLNNNERIIQEYPISLVYLLEHNQKYLQKIFDAETIKKLAQSLANYDDLGLTNAKIVKIFSFEYLKLLKEQHQQETRPDTYNPDLQRFINQPNNAIRVVWGNCLDILKQMESESIQLMVTSPPYYNARDYSQWENIDLYLEDMRQIIRESWRVLDNHRVWVWNVGDIFDNDRKVTKSVWGKRRIPLGAYFIKIFEEEGFEFVDDIMWDKGEVESKRFMNGGMDYPFYQYPMNCYEHILIFHKHRLDNTKIPCPVCGSLNVNGNTQSEIGVQSWECKNEKCFIRSPNNRGKRFSLRTNMMQYWFDEDKNNVIEKSVQNKWRRDIVPFSPVIKVNSKGENILGHSAPFPEDIPEMAIKYFSYAGEKVLDPFGGSFTTPIVARNLHRTGIGIELNKEMYREAILRKIRSSQNLFGSEGNLFDEF
ncbi:MAG: helix-turn-helix domain-containing protein [Bacteroidetes bacterium]|nr:MAG: helix-turn-helix domain-containing protein [Bacteroidota bacterium]